MFLFIDGLTEDWRRLDERIEDRSSEIETPTRHYQRLMTGLGTGLIISSAMVAAIGTGNAFSKGGDFGAGLGLVPKQISYIEARQSLPACVVRASRVRCAGQGRVLGALWP